MAPERSTVSRTISLYPWYKFVQSLLFWQATWFLYFQGTLSVADAILLYAVYDVSTTILEVPSGWMSDRLGRRLTLIISCVCGVLFGLFTALGDSFVLFAIGQVFLGASMALTSGTDSSLLFEALDAENRADEVRRHEMRAFQMSFAGLALSAIVGGALALVSPAGVFLLTSLSFVVALIICAAMVDPSAQRPKTSRRQTLVSLRSALTDPPLIWLFVFGVLTYGFGHVPFVFGQPYIEMSLAAFGSSSEAALVSGIVTAVMMALSVAVSWISPTFFNRLGLGGLLLFAFALQVAIILVLAVSNSAFAIAVLLLRKVPDSLFKPFVTAYMQPRLCNESRATYLSIRNLCAQLVFAATLWAASHNVSDTQALPFEELSTILGWYAGSGLFCLAVLALTVRVLSRD